ncbi:MAG: DUF4332 domain-containing protein [Burkholderiales bacterium]
MPSRTGNTRRSPLAGPIGRLAGSSRRLAEALARCRIHTIGDLLRVPAVPLFEALRGAADWETVRHWKSVAALLEIDGMTLPFAKALGARDVRTVRELADKPFGDATALLRAAARAARAPAPDAERVADVLRDAVRLQSGGVVMGTVLDARRHPVAGATVRLGGNEAHTDRQGRFRLTRLPHHAVARLEIRARGHVAATLEVARPDAYETTRVLVIPLARARRGAATRRRTPSQSELAGDRVAPSGWRTSIRRTLAASRVPAGEWVMLLSVNQGERKARLLSRLQRLEDDERVVLVYRVPLALLPAGSVVGANFLSTGAALLPARYAPGKLAAYRAFLAARGAVPHPRLPRDATARRRAIRSYVHALARSGALASPAHS